jgi:hypothetical protein
VLRYGALCFSTLRSTPIAFTLNDAILVDSVFPCFALVGSLRHRASLPGNLRPFLRHVDLTFALATNFTAGSMAAGDEFSMNYWNFPSRMAKNPDYSPE